MKRGVVNCPHCRKPIEVTAGDMLIGVQKVQEMTTTDRADFLRGLGQAELDRLAAEREQ